MTYRPAADSDLAAIASLMNRAYRNGDAASWTSESAYLAGDRTSETLLREDLAIAPQATLLKWQGKEGVIVGCVRLEPLGNATWYLGSLAVDPDHQGASLGRTLLAAAEDCVRERGGHHVRLTVINVRQPMIAWYRRRGYRETGETESFPYGDDRFGRPLRDDLCFVVLHKTL